jgi:hypothetical protein
MICSICRLDKPIEAFHKNKAQKIGIQYYCRLCDGAYNAGIKQAVMSYYSNGTPKCNCCGESCIDFLTIDHINNDGNKHRARYPAARSICKWLKANKFPGGFQVLCFNCNLGKRKYGYCPHLKEVRCLVAK